MGHCLEAQNNMMNMAGYLIITNVGMNGPYLLQEPSESGVKGRQLPPPPSKNVVEIEGKPDSSK